MKKIFFKDYLIEKYGKPLYRIPIDLPLSCPHRITGGGKGCSFCPEDGARARHLRNNLDLKQQVDEGIKYVSRRYGEDCGYIAYFQSFTNTNAPVFQLKKYYSEVLESANFAMVIISTRPDCLPDDVLDYLEELNNDYDLWIELGVQSANDETLEVINRQHDFQCVKDAVAKLAERNIKTAAHIILGLPGEGSCEFRKTAEEIAKLPFSAIKIHNLLILKNTPLARAFESQKVERSEGQKVERSEGPKVNTSLHNSNTPSSPQTENPIIQPLNEYEYADALIEFLTYIPDEWPLMRITADADPQDIVAPKWWMKKGQFFEYVRERLENPAKSAEKMPLIKTEDGSFTLYQPEYKQHFHSLAGAESEAEKKFIEPCGIRTLLENCKNLRILDVGFGLGYNAISVANLAKQIGKGKVEIVSLEKDLQAVAASLAMAKESEGLKVERSEGLKVERSEGLKVERSKGLKVERSEGLKVERSKGLKVERSEGQSESKPQNRRTVEPQNCRSEILQQVINQKKWESEYASIQILVGDARKTITQVEQTIDAVFLDPFSHEANPELWTYDFIKLVSARLANDGVIATYSNAFSVRGAMLRCGLSVGETPAFGRKKGGTIASFSEDKIKTPLSEKEMNILLKSTAGVPYRDPCLNLDRDEIINHRKKLVKRLQKKGVPKWFKAVVI